MTKITPQARDRAIGFVRQCGRRVDRAALECVLGEGDQRTLTRELAAFQNDDGGFGHAIEPDFRVPYSSVTATTVAFQYLITYGTSPRDEVARRGIEYLMSTYDTDARSWPPVCEQISDFPRAAWWDNEPLIVFAADKAHWANPSIEAIGILNRYAHLVDAMLLASLNEQARAWLDTIDIAEPHAILCAMRYGESLDGDKRRHARDRLAVMALKAVERDRADWATYAPQPVWFARGSDALLADAFGDALQENLDFVIGEQSADGSWQPAWTWGRYEEHWPAAKAEWAGYLTVSNLKMLIDFGRCESPG